MALPPIVPRPGEPFPTPPYTPPPAPAAPAPPEVHTTLSVEIVRRLITSTTYEKIFVVRARKFAIIADTENTVDLFVAAKQLTSDDTLAHDELTGGDSRLWESTRPGETLSMNVYARVPSGSATVTIWVWG